jgi:hypothetical protein
MGKIGGFKEYDRINEDNIAVQERVSNYNEFTIPLAKEEIKERIKMYGLRNPVSQLMSFGKFNS